MKNEAIFAVLVEGTDITVRMHNIVQSISVSDKSGTKSDTASIVLDDSAGDLVFPLHNAKITIMLGFRGRGMSVAFVGNVDEVRHSGGRSGMRITISAKGFDTSGKAKEPQQRHFDDATVEDMLTEAGEAGGVTDIRVDQELAAKTREYEQMDDESFVGFAERIAKEIGGVFKLRNGVAVMAKKNSGRTPSGEPLPPVFATYGDNLHGWDITPYIGRPRHKEARARYYDTKNAKHDHVSIATGVEGSEAVAVTKYRAPSKSVANDKADAQKADDERDSGVGSVTMEGDVTAQPEATCFVSGARQGIDGGYVIDGVDHQYSRGSGFVTKLTLAQRV